MKVFLSITICSLFFLCSCLKDEKSILVFDLKSQTEALKSHDKDALSEFSFANSEANFENVYKHIFKDKCISCHSAEFAELGVDLSQYSKVFDMSDFFSPVVVKGDSDASGVYLEVESGRMPPKEALSPEEVEFIKRWIDEGAIEGPLE